MKRMPLTKRNIDKIPFTTEGQATYWDTELPGFGLLVGKRSKTFLVQVDVKDPSRPKGYRTVRKTLGRYGDLTPEEARKLMSGREEERNGKRVFTPGKRMELRLTPPGGTGTDVTLEEILKAYYSERKTKTGHQYKKSTVDGATAIIQRQFASWLPLKIAELANLPPDTIIAKYSQAERSGPYAARNAFSILKAIMGYAIAKYPAVMDRNPFAVLTLPGVNLMKPIRAREECLHGAEFKQFHDRIQTFAPVIRDCFLLCLYQGLRRAEAESLQWEHVDLVRGEILIPDTKNRRALHVPVSRQSLQILDHRKAEAVEGSRWVFPTVRDDIGKTGHVQLSALTLKARTGLDITVHALRRTFITTGRRLKLHVDTDRLTNHVDSTVSGRHYDNTGVDDLRASLRLIDDEMERLMVEGLRAKVLQLPIRQ